MSKPNWSPIAGLNLSKSLRSQVRDFLVVAWCILLVGSKSHILQASDSKTGSNQTSPPTNASAEGCVTYSHNLSHPPWKSKDDYNSMVDWRVPRVISDDRITVAFNGACNEARSLNNLNHQTNPLPWCRNGVNPHHEAYASAKYNVHVLQEAKDATSSGKDEGLCHLLADSNEDPVDPGISVACILVARRETQFPTSSSPSTSQLIPTHPTPTESEAHVNPLIRKTSPVKHNSDSVVKPPTRPRFHPIHDGGFPELEQLEYFDDGEEILIRPDRIPSSSVKVPSSGHKAKDETSQSPRARKSGGKRSVGAAAPTTSIGALVGASPNAPTTSTAVIVYPAPFRHPFSRLTSPSSPGSWLAKVTQPSQSPPLVSVQPKADSIHVHKHFLTAPGQQSPVNPNDGELRPSPQTVEAGPISIAKPRKKDNSPETASGRFHWGEPGRLDVLWLLILASFEPFAVAKEMVERFRQCTILLTYRYESLKTWLRKVEAKSLVASGTQEVDGELQKWIKRLEVKEESYEWSIRVCFLKGTAKTGAIRAIS
ncbi:uncharacterized protein MELLADRAFT_69797 [Melampsora larici-populina 98AG31]|uniref:Uncharacterized protein n=1 Tax=Melampsora larici-populina (strain 98AG31 / pathotype 3-4-7) TaxID=747676 RepID=F4SC75_MELLP|nr:uncharacterized protein MELLADRAFT_69797 [Melampsora larici-populina 98AG31]EGF97760.1 hypothetical protein MELLADRAFT_69797 [Melampsora larici-populina 98AG31]